MVTPVYVQTGHETGLLNVLVTGFPIDEMVARELKKQTAGSDFVFLANGSAVASTLPYINAVPGSEDFHLTSGSLAQSFVTPNTADYQLAYDLDGNARPASGPRDAGSEQYGTAAGPITGDLNTDGRVNLTDLSIFLTHWQQQGTNLPEDFDHNNIVNLFDLSVLLSNYGT